MSDIAINQVLTQMRTVAAGISPEGLQAVESAGEPSFAKMMADAISEVNQAMRASQSVQERFESGDSSLSIAEVMITSQKANIQFTGMIEVRNKLLSAYQDIMNMQI